MGEKRETWRICKAPRSRWGCWGVSQGPHSPQQGLGEGGKVEVVPILGMGTEK